MSNAVPEGWEVKTVGDIGSVVTGSTPSTTEPLFWGGATPFISPADFDGKIYIDKTSRTLSDEGTKKARELPKDAILVTCIGSLGGMALTSKPSVTNQQINAVVAEENQESRFHFYNILFNMHELIKSAGTTTLPIINKSTFSQINLLFPPLLEQQKIATILSSVDDVIEKTRAQIDKLKDLKTGMMQELLTKGIGHTEFKDSPVGRIPKGWECKKIDQLAGFVTSGSRGWAQYYSEAGPIFIRIGNLTREHINLRFNDTVYVSPPDSAEGKRTQVQLGDVLISITADLGVIGVINESIGEAYVNQHVSLVRLSDPTMARWVGHFLAFENTQKQFIENNDAGAKAGLNLSAIRNTMVAIPWQHEREKIVAILDSIDRDIVMKRSMLDRVFSIKKALMQDLLTGKVRVKLNESATIEND